MLTEKQIEDLHVLNDLRKQVELLDSHMVVGFINQKQYFESMEGIKQKVEELEEKYEIEPETRPESLKAFDLMFSDGIKKYNEMLDGIFK